MHTRPTESNNQGRHRKQLAVHMIVILKVLMDIMFSNLPTIYSSPVTR